MTGPGAARKRDEGQLARLLDYIRGRDAGMLRRDFVLELARRPLPADDRLRELELELERAARPVPVDSVLAGLRRDYALSGRQMEHRRLTAVQDLAWALINTPAFLFNRCGFCWGLKTEQITERQQNDSSSRGFMQ